MNFHMTRSFPVPISRLWDVAVQRYAESDVWDRSVHTGEPIPDAKHVDGVEHSAFVFQTGYGELSVQILEVDRVEDGGRMVYTITDGLPGVVKNGTSTWTFTSDGSSKTTLEIDVNLVTNTLGTFLSPLLRMMFMRGDRQMSDDLYHYVVTGTPSEAKKKALAKRQRQ